MRDDGELREAELAGEALAEIIEALSGGTVKCIAIGRTWKHVPQPEPYEGWDSTDFAEAEADRQNDIEREEGL